MCILYMFASGTFAPWTGARCGVRALHIVLAVVLTRKWQRYWLLIYTGIAGMSVYLFAIAFCSTRALNGW